MKIVFLQLSDLHIENGTAIHMEKVRAVKKSLSVFAPFEGAVIAIAGDVAASGKYNEYKLAEKLIGSLSAMFKDEFHISEGNLKVLIVPGNHDVNNNKMAEFTREEVEAFYSARTVESKLEMQVEKSDEFFNFARHYLCFLPERLFVKRTLFFQDDNCDCKYRIEANLFNSAPFSSKRDNGIHYMPQNVFHELSRSCVSDFCISIMHHAPEWFCPEHKNILNELIYSKSNLVLYGHEHYENSKEIKSNNSGAIIINGGGAWWKRDSLNSEYYAGVLDTETRDYQQFKYSWVQDGRFYLHSEEKKTQFTYRCINGSNLEVKQSYIDELLHDEKHMMLHDFSKYFVFPSLKKNCSDEYDDGFEIHTQLDFLKELEKTNHLAISGNNSSGKTTLLKWLFLQLSRHYTVLYCGTKEVAGKNQENIIRETFADIYGTGKQYEVFQQQDQTQKIIIIDDCHRIKPEHLKKLLTNLNKKFKYIIISGTENTTFDIKAMLVKELGEDKDDFVKYSILKFYAEKRAKLIQKAIATFAGDSLTGASIREIEHKIEKSLNAQKLIYRVDPDFIIQYVNYYCTHLHELQSKNINVFSKVFEASIEFSINPHLRHETVGQIKTALSEVAHYIHFGKRYPIGVQEISEIVQAYAKNYEEKLSAQRFLDVVLSAKILECPNDDFTYIFKNKDHLAYFTAEAILRKGNETGATDDLRHVAEYSCFGINPTILKFITYMTSNVQVINLLIKQAVDNVKDWTSFSLDEQNIHFLTHVKEEAGNIPAIDAKEKERHETAKIEKEEDTTNSDVVEVLGLYDYKESDIDQLNFQIIRAYSQMNVLAGCLTSFSHMMPAATKRDLISVLYSMPDKIFYQWGKEIDLNWDQFIGEFIDEVGHKGERKGHIKREKVEKAIHQISTVFLINLYYSIAGICATSSTIDNIANDDYVTNTNQRIERMMFYEQADNWALFFKEATALYDETKSGMAKNLITLMVCHVLTWSPTLPRTERERAIEKFKLSHERTKILLRKGTMGKKE